MSDQPLPELVPERKPRLTPVPESHRESIREFLEHFLLLYERAANDYRALAMQHRTTAYEADLAFHKAKVATIRGLLSYNETRRRVKRTTKAG